MTRIDPETAGRVNAVVLDVMSAFKNSVELYWATPELVKAAGYERFEDWVRGQPKPQLTAGSRRELAAQYVELGMTQREAAAALGVDHRTIGRDVGANAPEESPIRAQLEPELGANAPVPIVPQKERPISQRMTVTEVRQRIRAVQTNLSLLRHGEIVSTAYPLMRELLMPTIDDWTQHWSESTPEGVTE